MSSNSEGCYDLIKLAKELRSEKLFIQSELECLRALNEKLERNSVELAQATWTSTQQRSNVKQLFAQGDPSSPTCCQKIDCILSPVFVDAHKVLRYQDALVLSALIQRVRASPAVASLWLAAAETNGPISTAEVARALCGGLYISDVAPVRRVLQYFARHRLANAEDPRRMICQGQSSFTRLYSELVEGFRPARLFLAAALKVPMLPLLQIDVCLIIDPDKVMERIKRSSSISTNKNWQEQLFEYRNWTINTLVTLVEKFVSSLREIWMCFPPTVAWIVRQTALALQSNQRTSEEDIHSICTTLVFTNFICQAIINPDAYGITDIPITNVSRFNLGQVALTLQTLCLMKYQEIDGKFRDLYSRFERDCIYSLLDILVENSSYSAVPNEAVGYELSDNGDLGDDLTSENNACESDDKDSLKIEPTVNPNIALFTRNDIQLLVTLLKKIPMTSTVDYENGQINRSKLIDSRSEDDLNDSSAFAANVNKNENNNLQEEKFSGEIDNEENDGACGVSHNNNNLKKNDFNEIDLPQDDEFYHLLKDINPDTISKLQKLLKRLPDSNFNKENLSNQNTNAPTSLKGKAINNFQIKYGNKKNKDSLHQSQEVLVIKLPGDNTCEPIGMVAENKVLEYHYSTMLTRHTLSEELLQHDIELPSEKLKIPEQDTKNSGRSILNNASGTEINSQASQEKRTRFSLSHDEGSIGNTSDNLEAVSEAASNHSVTSSLEMETEDQNDNLSDMVSANVSGRGSPNISGRDTPSSQVTEGEVGVANSQPLRHPSSIPNTVTTSKQAKLLKRTRHDIEDKFCKFEIKKVIEGDETFSILSDTWSTDVLASDSETIAETTYDRAFITPILTLSQQSVSIGSIANSVAPSVAPSQPDVSETASESAWSTDALVSDSDRMTEVDMDDCNSVTRSETDGSRFDRNPILANVANSQNSFPADNENGLANNSQNLPPTVPDESNNIEIDVVNNEVEADGKQLSDNSSAVENTHRNEKLGAVGIENTKDNKIYNTQLHTIVQSLGEMTSEMDQNYLNGFMNTPSNIEEEFAQKLSLSNLTMMKSTNESNDLMDMNISNEPNPKMFDLTFKEEGLNNLDILNSQPSTSSINLNINKSPVIQIVNNGNATSRWLNDPCQKFPKQADPNQYFPNIDFTNFNIDNVPKEDMSSICQNMENISFSKPDCMFRPIKHEESALDNGATAVYCESQNETDSKNIVENINLESIKVEENTKRPLNKESNQNDADLCNINFHSNGVEFRTKPNNLENTFTHSNIPLGNSHIESFKINNITTSKVLEANGPKNKIGTANLSKVGKSPNKSLERRNESPLNEVISSGSAISLSNLSVNSIDTTTSDRSSSQDVNSENITERRVTPPLINNNSIPNSTDLKTVSNMNGNDSSNTSHRQSATFYTNSTKPGPSTGAIPKSISFDATAEKSHRYSGRRVADESNDSTGINFGDLKNNVKRSGGIFLNKIKLFRNKNRGHGAPSGNFNKRGNIESNDECLKPGDSDLPQNPDVKTQPTKSSNELSEDILAKYRRKASSSSEAATSDSTSHSGSTREKNRDIIVTYEDTVNVSDVDSAPDKHSNNEFENLRREIRLVLSNMDIHGIELPLGHSSSLALACALRLEGAWGGPIASRALGALVAIDSTQGSLLLKALRADSAARRPYINYLSKCRKSLLSTIATLESEHSWQMNEVKRQGALAIATRARSSLSAREPRLIALQEKLRTGLVDERRDALFVALQSLSAEITGEDNWAGASEWELEQANMTIERVVLGRVYRQAMFPNGDGDIMRDQLLRDHIAKLWANVVDVPTPRLRNIPLVPAERIINYLSVYKAPRDKVDCVVHFVKSIINLLSISSDSAPGADDLTPVLVYVLIKANPPSLLSTVQFVNTFIESPLEGEQLYCWTQFCAAIEYIKTLD